MLSVRKANLSGISDDEVYQIACNENRVIITMDKDFTRMFRFPPENCGGIIVVKIYKRNVDETLEIFKKNFKQIKEDDISNNMVAISPQRIRIRRT